MEKLSFRNKKKFSRWFQKRGFDSYVFNDSGLRGVRIGLPDKPCTTAMVLSECQGVWVVDHDSVNQVSDYVEVLI